MTISIRFAERNAADVRDWVNEHAPDGVSWFVTQSMTAPTGMQAWRYIREGKDWPSQTHGAVFDPVSQDWLPINRGDTIVRRRDGSHAVLTPATKD